MRQRRAFTLIELLVVIAIIAVLMSILMPALRRVREQARQRACGSRVRQHVLAMTMYADDNDTRFPLPQNGGYWLWDIRVETVNFMVKTGMTPEMFYCPSNDNQQKNFDFYWEFTGEWDGQKFIDGTYIVSGYCYLLAVTGNPQRPAIRDIEKKTTGPKEWVKTTQHPNPGSTELVIDATLGQQQNNAKHGYNFGLVTIGGMYSQYGIHDRTSHLKSDEEPAGGNMGFLDGHVDWRHFSDMENRFGGNGVPTFWW